MEWLRELSVQKIVDSLLKFGNEAVRLIGGYAVILSPVMIPLAPVSIITILLYGNILTAITSDGLRLAVSLLVGLALESFALACLIVSRHAEEFNLTREPGEPRMNQGVGKWALAAYIVLGISMVVVGEILPHYAWLEDAQVARWTLLGFFLLAPFGHWVFSTEHNIVRLEARRRARRNEAKIGRDDDLRLAEQQTALREREAAIKEREAQAEAIRANARAAEIEAQAKERGAEAEIIRQRAALTRAETRKEQTEQSPEQSAHSPQPVQRIGELDELLRIIHQESGNGTFDAGQVREWTRTGRTKSFEILKYGEQVGDVRRMGKGQYVYRNGKVANG